MAAPTRLGWLRRLQATGPTPDGELIRRFHDHADQDAFELLIYRHAPAVLRVCRAVTRDAHLAEDAAQATFLVLARKARTLAGVRSVSAWAARVALRAAARVRDRAAARPTVSLTADVPGRGKDPAEAVASSDLAAVVLEEVYRLPERYQAPLVLCHLEGLTLAGAAERLGCPVGTVAGRLSRARAKLKGRLARRGVVAPAAALAALGGRAASAVPAGFAARALGAALDPVVVELAREVLRSMSLSLSQVVLRCVAAVGLLATAVALPLVAGDEPPAKQGEKKVAARPADPRLAFDEQLAKEKKFVVVGTVMSADGKTPLGGVTMTASTGMGTLRPAGTTTTDKDGRFRLVFPGWGVAIVHAGKPGWHAWTYGWPAQYLLSEKRLAKGDVSKGYDNIVPGQPSPLEFRMQPAAALRARFVGGDGKPLAGMRVALTGDNLPPGAGVFASGRTDADGRFTADNVPRYRNWLVLEDDAGGERRTLTLWPVHFRDAAEYEVVATVYSWDPNDMHVSQKVTRGKDR